MTNKSVMTFISVNKISVCLSVCILALIGLNVSPGPRLHVSQRHCQSDPVNLSQSGHIFITRCQGDIMYRPDVPLSSKVNAGLIE